MAIARNARCWTTRRQVSLAALLVIAVALSGGLQGCRSCRDEAEVAKADKEKQKEKKKEQEKLKKEKAKLKPDFEPLKLGVWPGDAQSQVQVRAVKPGHWTSAVVDAQANNFDFPGELRAEVIDARNNPVGIERTTFHLVTSRPAILAKGQKKQLDFSFLVPQGDTKTRLQTGLLDRRGGGRTPPADVLTHMPCYEYYLVVIGRQASRYKFLKLLDSVRPPSAEMQSGEPDLYYRVVLPSLAGRIPLPTQPLCWTSLAYVIWDDAEPTLLLPDQQKAMLDWLYWGGQLVISGPETLDVLGRGFLAPYLPATRSGTRELDTASLERLDQAWTIAGPKSKPLRAVQPWAGIALEKHPQGSFLPGTGKLLVERRVGRGRVVVSSFRLSQPELVAWPSFDSFFNACILRRPPRKFTSSHGFAEVEWSPKEDDRWDPGKVTSLRYFSRDARGKEEPQAEPAIETPERQYPLRQPMPQQDSGSSARRLAALRQPGVAGWNDFSAVSNTARRSLREAAGIMIPSRHFVVSILGVYLLVLVPINWALFRVLGRIELAWIAAPVIAVVGAVAVIRLAQLDIGFARSQTEIAVLELHAGYPRAHLTRYTALYTSLSSSYDVSFDDPSAVAQPLSNEFSLISGQRLSNVNYRCDRDVRLSDIEIRSNSTSMLHSEQMYELSGSLSLNKDAAGRWTVHNGTKLALAGAGVVRLRAGATPQVDAAWIGTLGPGQEAQLQFKATRGAPWSANRKQALNGTRSRAAGAINLDHLLALAQEPRDMSPGDMRLVGWMEGPLRGLGVQPAAPQVRQATLVVANLRFADYGPPQPDQMLRIDVGDLIRSDPADIDE